MTMNQNENQNENDVSLWREDPTRSAGSRQTLKIGDAEYGFCWIPPGEFDMGSPESEEGRRDDEILHHVRLTRGFWLLETEVTQALFKEVMKTNPSDYIFMGDDLPVSNALFDDALAFCNVLTRLLPSGLKATLPTEAQWEYACRAGTKTPFWFGNTLNGDKANCNGYHPYGTDEKGRRLETPTPGKEYDPNPWGVYDAHGNVYEWVLDWYGEYPVGTAVDPVGPKSGSSRVVRSASCGDYAVNCRSASRRKVPPDSRLIFFGFRFLLSCDESGRDERVG